MTQQFHPSSLTDYTARTWQDDEDATAAKFNGEFGSTGSTGLQTKVQNLNDAIQDVNTCQASATAPAVQEGQIWFNTTDDKWFGDPDGAGADDDFLTRIKAYNVSVATAGTDTFKLSGVTQRLTTENELTATGTLVTVTLSAGILGANGQAIRVCAAFQKVSNAGTGTIDCRFGNTPASRFAFSFSSDTTGSYWIEALFTRTSTIAAKCVGYALSEAEGDSVAAYAAAASDVVMASTMYVAFVLTGISAGRISFQMATVEILH